MKKLILLFILLASPLFSQTATNKIQNTATIMLTNSTLYVGGTNMVINGTRYNSGEILKIYGRDGLVQFVTVTPFHSRMAIVWFTNQTGTVAGWSAGSDLDSNNSLTWGIKNEIDVTIPFSIISNQQIRLNIPFVIASSNLVVSNTATILSTNNARFYMVNGIPGLSISVTNVGVGFTNVEVFGSGVLTNKFTIP